MLGTLVLSRARAGLGTAFGVVTVAVPAYATMHGSEALAGVLLAVLGSGSVLGGICYGAARTRTRAPLPRQFALLLAGLAASYAVFAAMTHPVAPAIALFLGGGLVAPVLTVENTLVGRIMPVSMRTEVMRGSFPSRLPRPQPESRSPA